ncbi:MAG: efflux RND transporter permease subunit, partial [Tepidisphaeraceae bacterium]
LMTTVAFVAGMIPLLISNREGASVNKAISGVVIGGQTLTILMTLLATQDSYSLFDDLARGLRWLTGARGHGVVESIESRPSPAHSGVPQQPHVPCPADG